MPKKLDTNYKTVRINCACSQLERDHALQISEAMGMSLSDLIRFLINSQYVVMLQNKALESLILDLNTVEVSNVQQ